MTEQDRFLADWVGPSPAVVAFQLVSDGDHWLLLLLLCQALRPDKGQGNASPSPCLGPVNKSLQSHD